MEKEPDSKLEIYKLIKDDQLDEVKKIKPEFIKKQRNKDGESPLHYALKECKFDIAVWLIENRCFNSLFDTNKDGKSFLQICFLVDPESDHKGAFTEHYLPSVLSGRQISFFKEVFLPVIRQIIERTRFSSLEEEFEFIEKCRKTFRELFPLYDYLQFKILACQRNNNFKMAYEICTGILQPEESENYLEVSEEKRRARNIARLSIAEMYHQRRIQSPFSPRLPNIHPYERENIRIGILMYEYLRDNDEPAAKQWLSKIHGLFITGKFSVTPVHERLPWLDDVTKAFNECYEGRIIPALKRRSSLARSGSGFFKTQPEEKATKETKREEPKMLKRKRSSSGLSQEFEKQPSSSSSSSGIFREAKRARKDDSSKPPRKDDAPKPKQ